MPTVVIGNNTGDDYSGTEDAFIASDNTTGNFGGREDCGVTNSNRALIRFTGLDNIPSGSTISASPVSFYGSGWGGTCTINVYWTLRNWVEGTQTGQNRSGDSPYSCCWSEYGSGNTWTSAGCDGGGNDRESSYLLQKTDVSCPGSKTRNIFSSTNIVNKVQDVVDGDANYGFVFIHDDGDPYFGVSSEGTDGQRPYLSVTYTESGSTGNSYYYQQQQM